MLNNEEKIPISPNRVSEVEEFNSEVFQVLVSIVSGIVLYAFVDIYWVTIIGFSTVIYSFLWYMESLGRGSAIMQIMQVIASFQWILGPIIAYHFGGETLKYRMYVPEDVYMDFAVPAVIFFMLGLRIFNSRVSLNTIASYVKQGGLSSIHIFLLMLIGLTVEFIVPFIPRSLYFAAYILAQFKYIGLLYFIVVDHRLRWHFTFAIFLLSLISSAEEGLFHGLILWSALIFSYICVVIQFSRFRKIIIFAISIFLMISLQTIKGDYRELIAASSSTNQSNISILIDMLMGSTLDNNDGESKTDIGDLNARLNQGWIISAVMNNVPSKQPFVEGETVITAVSDSLIPRFLLEKRNVLVSDNFKKFTGLELGIATSMGISVLGESYVNFGVFGGVIFMFFWGVIIATLMKIIIEMSKNHPTIILWTPLIFLQMVKAETEIAVVLNHGIKTSIAIGLFYFTAKKIFGWKI